MAIATALFDANVLASMTMTDLVIETAHRPLFAARWTEQIHQEWIGGLMKANPRYKRESLERRRLFMDENAPDCLITGYEPLIPLLELPDPDDRHVLAAAITGRCDVIVTLNLKDFPAIALATHGIKAVHPDAFLCDRFAENEAMFVASVGACRDRMRNPPRTADDYIAQLDKVGLPKLAAMLSDHRVSI